MYQAMYCINNKKLAVNRPAFAKMIEDTQYWQYCHQFSMVSEKSLSTPQVFEQMKTEVDFNVAYQIDILLCQN